MEMDSACFVLTKSSNGGMSTRAVQDRIRSADSRYPTFSAGQSPVIDRSSWSPGALDKRETIGKTLSKSVARNKRTLTL